MKVEIINPEKGIFDGEALLVQLPGKDGSFEILDNHAPMISVLKKGKIRLVEKDKQEKFFEVNGGVVEVLKNKVLVLAD
ncbi:MAG: ATP synthase F1 subunit epsilon [Bacteroidales bacterium]|nr:ATP synthase F1 subunit epsilon [Bacteroidales bacterium]